MLFDSRGNLLPITQEPTERPFRQVSMSELSDYLKCPTRWYFKHVLRRTPRSTPVPFIVGNVWHAYLASRLNGQDYETAWAPLEAVYPQTLMELEAKRPESHVKKFKSEFDSCRAGAPFWTDPFPGIETLAIEEPMSLQLEVAAPRAQKILLLEIVGTPDRPSKWNGYLWDQQHKTIDKSKPFDLFFSTFSRNLHQTAYAPMMQARWLDIPYRGVLLDLFRKFSPKTIKARPQDAFKAMPIVISTDQLNHQAENMRNILSRMMDDLLLPELIYENPEMDLGFYGNSKDPYLAVLQGRETLQNDELFMDTPDRYAPTEAADD